MSSTSATLSSLAGRPIRWSIILSVLMIVAGAIAIIVPPAAGIAVTLLVAWLLIFSGVMHFVYAWHTRSTGAMLWEILVGFAYVLVGAYMLAHPLLGMASLTLALAIYLFAEAVLEFVLAARLRPRTGSGWFLIDGIITLILAVMIWRTWPSSTAWVLGILVGISMLFSGITRLMISLAVRKLIAQAA